MTQNSKDDTLLSKSAPSPKFMETVFGASFFKATDREETKTPVWQEGSGESKQDETAGSKISPSTALNILPVSQNEVVSKKQRPRSKSMQRWTSYSTCKPYTQTNGSGIRINTPKIFDLYPDSLPYIQAHPEQLCRSLDFESNNLAHKPSKQILKSNIPQSSTLTAALNAASSLSELDSSSKHSLEKYKHDMTTATKQSLSSLSANTLASSTSPTTTVSSKKNKKNLTLETLHTRGISDAPNLSSACSFTDSTSSCTSSASGRLPTSPFVSPPFYKNSFDPDLSLSPSKLSNSSKPVPVPRSKNLSDDPYNSHKTLESSTFSKTHIKRSSTPSSLRKVLNIDIDDAETDTSQEIVLKQNHSNTQSYSLYFLSGHKYITPPGRRSRYSNGTLGTDSSAHSEFDDDECESNSSDLSPAFSGNHSRKASLNTESTSGTPEGSVSALGLIDERFSSSRVKQSIHDELKLAKTKGDLQIKQLLEQLYQKFDGIVDEKQNMNLSNDSIPLDVIPECSSRQHKPPKEFSRPKSWPPAALTSSHVTLLTRIESLARQILDVGIEDLDQKGKATEIMAELQQLLDEQKALAVGNILVEDFLASLVWIFAPCARLVGDLQKIKEERVVFDTSDLIRVETPTILEFTSPFRPTSPLRNECSQNTSPELALSRPLFTPPILNTIPASPIQNKSQSLPPSPIKALQSPVATISPLSESTNLSRTPSKNMKLQPMSAESGVASKLLNSRIAGSPPFLEKRRVSEGAIQMRSTSLIQQAAMDDSIVHTRAGSDIDQVFLNGNLEKELMLRRGNLERTPTKPKEHRKSGRQVINFFKSLKLTMSSGTNSFSTPFDTPPQTPTRTGGTSSENTAYRPRLDREQSRKS
ncbi:hypothetical protein K7432_013105, partial [Basidiobolus ranarum]